MSSNVCRPLKRAKSTVGVPLSNGTLVPPEVMALTLSSCTENEVTAATGASVPTTKAGPVAASEVTLPGVMLLVHPATDNTATVSKGSASRKNLSCEWGDIFGLFLYASP